MYKKLRWASYFYDGDKWYKNLWHRVKMATKCLLFGYIDVEESMIIRGTDHINSFIEALEEGKEKIKRKSE
jgi:hypothetical protein